jgi:hypothetical protein
MKLKPEVQNAIYQQKLKSKMEASVNKVDKKF